MDLNKQQREAVEHGDGPLLIVAGAGTGKTRVIVERVGHWLRNGLKPESILALTFAKKAAEEMHRRAVEQFGEPARRCRFSTFHAFCYDLLREELPLRALDRIDQWIFFRRHLEELEPDTYLKISEPGRFLHDLVDFCSRCHDNLVSPDDLRRHAEKRATEYEQAVREGGSPGKEAKQEVARLRELARVYERSEELQAREGLLSFGAMISQAVSRLKASEQLRQARSRYRLMLVDEYQDTNAAQLELVSLLAGEPGNVTVVGDEYQAIYRFRGASYGSFDLFKERFPHHPPPVVLDQNYRSTKSILDVAEALARKLERYDPNKKLTPTKAPGRQVEVAEFASVEQQAEWVAAELEAGLARYKLAREKEDQPEPQSPLFAVLYRAHAHRGPLVAALQRRGIPFVIRNLAVNKLPPIRNLTAYLRAIGHPDDTVSLMRVLADPQWGLGVLPLIAYCRAARNRRVPLRAVIEEDEAGWPGRQRLLALLERYRQLAAQDRLVAWLEALRRELGLGGDAASDAALRTFSGFVAKWDQEKSQSGMLAEFLEYFSYFEEAGGVVALPEEGDDESAVGDAFLLHAQEGVVAEQLPLLQEASTPAASQKILLMTVHAAKGLEFEHVYLFHLLRGAFPVRNRKPLISLPDELWKGPLLAGDFHIEEERRLFYVALTRARSTLTLCTVSNDRQRPSPFLQELAEPPNPHLHWKKPAVVAPPSESGGAAESAPSTRHSRIGEWASSVLPAPDGFSLSASGLETYLQCPLKYQFSYRWQIPLPPTPPMLFGSAMHAAVKEAVAALAGGAGSFTRDSLEAILNRHWPAAGFPDPLQERKYREEGLRQLEGACRAWSEEPFELLHQEKRFEFEWGGTALNGRMDQINRTAGGDVELIEYKTGTPQTQKDADRSPQLTLYAEACRRVAGQAPGSLVLFNLATGERIRTSRTPEQLQALERLVRQTATAMQAGRYPARPGFLCRYCDFRPICPAHEESDPGSTGG